MSLCNQIKRIADRHETYAFRLSRSFIWQLSSGLGSDFSGRNTVIPHASKAIEGDAEILLPHGNNRSLRPNTALIQGFHMISKFKRIHFEWVIDYKLSLKAESDTVLVNKQAKTIFLTMRACKDTGNDSALPQKQQGDQPIITKEQ